MSYPSWSEIHEAVAEQRATVRRRYGRLVGCAIDDLPTPALLLDRAAVRANISRMAEWAASHAALRPHAKAHKCAEIAQLQMAAGAVGITCATAWEAVNLVDAGVSSVLVANEVVDPRRLAALAEAARVAEVMVAVDSVEGAKALADAGRRAGIVFGALVEVDTGMGRGGVRSAAEAAQVAASARGLDGLAVRGVMTWEGHVALEGDRQVRSARAGAAIDRLVECAEAVSRAGVFVEIVCAGGTNTYDLTGADPRVTDIQAGSYVLMDTSYRSFAPAFRPALSILGQVTSLHGRRAILDCGTKELATLIQQPEPTNGCGVVREVHEEHSLLDLHADSTLALGDRVELLASYCSGTVALHDAYLVVEDGRVVDVWPIARAGFLPVAAMDLERP
jgi:D-serine deaminase-like pyridoxal phosphate-dependent protein